MQLEHTMYSPVSDFEGQYPFSGKTPDLRTSSPVDEEKELLIPYVEEEKVREAITWFVKEVLSTLIDENTVLLHNMKGAETFYREMQHVYEELQPGLTFDSHEIKVGRISGFKETTKKEEFAKVQWVDQSIIQGKRVLIIEDINDTGRTLAYTVERLIEEGAAAVETVVLFEKILEETAAHIPTYALLRVIHEFLVGWGLDEGTDRFRDLVTLCILKSKEELTYE